jgi:hypothetical protein
MSWREGGVSFVEKSNAVSGWGRGRNDNQVLTGTVRRGAESAAQPELELTPPLKWLLNPLELAKI